MTSNSQTKFDGVFKKFGFEQSAADSCVYRGTVLDVIVLLVIYIDDGLLFFPNENAIAVVLAEL